MSVVVQVIRILVLIQHKCHQEPPRALMVRIIATVKAITHINFIFMSEVLVSWDLEIKLRMHGFHSSIKPPGMAMLESVPTCT